MLVVDMKKTLLPLLLFFSLGIAAQQITLKKGIIIDNIPTNDSIAENFALYLPTNFEITKKWPIVFVYDMQGRGKQVISMFRQAAEEQGYILAASNNVNDTLTLSKNILVSSRMFNTIYSILPIKKDRSYSAGFASGARMASLVPTFVKEVQGVISCGSPVANEEVLSAKNKFHFIGIVGNEDYNYTTMLSSQKLLNKLKFQNQLLVFEGGHEWPKSSYLAKAMEIFSLTAMEKGIELKDDGFVNTTYQKNLGEVSTLLSEQKPLLANKLLGEMTSIYKSSKNVDSLKENSKTLRKTKLYKTQIRSQNAAFFKENFIKDEYSYLLEEDVLSYNYNNLGWWSYQMDELTKYEKSTSIFERQMGKRLKGYLNALIADNIDAVKAGTVVDEEALTFLWMINTISDPNNPVPYLKVIANSSRVEDYGTALFYIEELLKRGYTNKTELYALEHTAILRLTPEFNELVTKYLKEARYDMVPVKD